MITDLARLLRFQHPPGRGERRQSLAGRTLQVDAGVRREPVSLLELRRRAGEQLRGKRGIEEHYVERPGGAREITERVAALDNCISGLPFVEALAQRTCRRRIALDEGDVSRAARERFEAERAAASEQIEAACTVNRRAQPVEERLAYAIRGGPDGRTRRETQFPAAPRSADDAQHARPARPLP